MHVELVRLIVAKCQKREAEGDCPSEDASPTETLENTVISLASMLTKILQTDERGQGTPYAEAMAIAARAVDYDKTAKVTP